jgi:HPt (histidine-containing phosphotransfer) domain-containing protein
MWIPATYSPARSAPSRFDDDLLAHDRASCTQHGDAAGDVLGRLDYRKCSPTLDAASRLLPALPPLLKRHRLSLRLFPAQPTLEAAYPIPDAAQRAAHAAAGGAGVARAARAARAAASLTQLFGRLVQDVLGCAPQRLGVDVSFEERRQRCAALHVAFGHLRHAVQKLQETDLGGRQPEPPHPTLDAALEDLEKSLLVTSKAPL